MLSFEGGSCGSQYVEGSFCEEALNLSSGRLLDDDELLTASLNNQQRNK